MKITFVTVSPTAIDSLKKGAGEINAEYGNVLTLKTYYAVADLPKKDLEEMAEDIISGGLVFVDLMGSPPRIIGAVYGALEKCRGNIVPFGSSAREFLRLGSFEPGANRRPAGIEAKKSMKDMKAMAMAVPPEKMRDMSNYASLCKYFTAANDRNMKNMLLLILSQYGGLTVSGEIEPPVEIPDVAYMLPEDMSAAESLEEYREKAGITGTRPSVALLCSSTSYPTDTSGCVRDIFKELSTWADVYIVGIASWAGDDRGELLEKLLNDARPDAVVNVMPFRLSAGPMGGDTDAGVTLLQGLNTPYLHPHFITRRQRQQWQDSVQGCTPSEVLISVMLPELDGATDTIPVAAMVEPEEGILTEKLDIIPERLHRLSGKLKGYIRLRKLSNSEKRVAVICYNYPPGEANLFGGAFLDTFQSVAAITSRLSQEGYSVKPLSKEDLMAVFTAGKAVNSGKYETDWDEKITWNAKNYVPAEDVTRRWGPSPGDVMTEDGSFIIPGMVEGNVFIGLQPTRGIHEDPQHAYHDKSSPPHHQYAAFYEWLRDVFKADAIIHVGTHGTLEFTKGKECGMSGDCWPDRLLGDIPHFYIYYVGNPSEATIAKRRSGAHLVSYQPPVFIQSGLYGDYLSLETEIDNYRHALAISPAGAEDVYKNIAELSEKLGISGNLDDIENELYRVKTSLIPRGLHVFGTPYTEEEADMYRDGLAQCLGGGEDTPKAADRGRRNALENGEMDGLVRSLGGEFIPARLGGDIFRNPDILPAGGNIFQFDPRLVPTASAFKRGQEICRKTLELYESEGRGYPASVAIIMWGLDTSRTQGETFSQILSYLGVRKATSSDVWNNGFEVIPIEELGRPRIDVTVNICGFFRDMFPNLIETLDDIFHTIASLDETYEQNYFKKHSDMILKSLIEAGYDEEEARDLSVSRIFGPEEGQYGTNLTSIIETKNWTDERIFGESFMDSLCHVYGRYMHGRTVDGLYSENLKTVDIVSQLRANCEYEITDLDHYYEFFGGLSKSVELAKGAKACMYITDTTGSRIQTETADASVNRGLRTRTLNPQWIDAMLKHDYHGAQKIAERFENVMGLAATTGTVSQELYNDLHSRYVSDPEMRRRMGENNPYAYMDILQQMAEYSGRGYWDATEEQLEEIRSAYLELEDRAEDLI